MEVASLALGLMTSQDLEQDLDSGGSDERADFYAATTATLVQHQLLHEEEGAALLQQHQLLHEEEGVALVPHQLLHAELGAAVEHHQLHGEESEASTSTGEEGIVCHAGEAMPLTGKHSDCKGEVSLQTGDGILSARQPSTQGREAGCEGGDPGSEGGDFGLHPRGLGHAEGAGNARELSAPKGEASYQGVEPSHAREPSQEEEELDHAGNSAGAGGPDHAGRHSEQQSGQRLRQHSVQHPEQHTQQRSEQQPGPHPGQHAVLHPELSLSIRLSPDRHGALSPDLDGLLLQPGTVHLPGLDQDDYEHDGHLHRALARAGFGAGEGMMLGAEPSLAHGPDLHAAAALGHPQHLQHSQHPQHPQHPQHLRQPGLEGGGGGDGGPEQHGHAEPRHEAKPKVQRRAMNRLASYKGLHAMTLGELGAVELPEHLEHSEGTWWVWGVGRGV